MSRVSQSALLCLLLTTASASCKSDTSSGKKAENLEKVAPAKVVATEIEAKPEAESSPHGGKIHWIENDYNKALALAKKEKKPLLIDMWADWCHTCLAMKSGALKDPGLNEVADTFVWLAIDTEDPSSAAVMKRFPPAVWPTFYVVSPEDESVQATQRGSSSVREFREFLARGDSGHRAQLAAGGELGKDSPLFHLREADRGVLAGDWHAAAASYQQALKLGGANWNYAATTHKNRISMLSRLEDKKPCAEMAVASLSEVAEARSSASTDFIYYASTCAKGVGDAAAITSYRKTLLATLDEILSSDEASLSADDRSDSLAIGRKIAGELEDKTLAMQYARTQQTVLQNAVKAAGNAKEEMTYIWHQVSLHVYLEEGDKILPWVQSLVTRLPKEYDPPYRHAWLLLKLEQHEKALAAVSLALPLVDGGRKGRVLSLQAEIYAGMGKGEEERASRQAVVDHYKSLAPGLAKASSLTNAEEALAALK